MKKFFLFTALSLVINCALAQSSETFRMVLGDDWQMQSAVKDPDAGRYPVAKSVSAPGLV